MYVEPEGDFVFVCQKSNLVSRALTKNGVAVIRLANKYPCRFLIGNTDHERYVAGIELIQNLIFPDPERISQSMTCQFTAVKLWSNVILILKLDTYERRSILW